MDQKQKLYKRTKDNKVKGLAQAQVEYALGRAKSNVEKKEIQEAEPRKHTRKAQAINKKEDISRAAEPDQRGGATLKRRDARPEFFEPTEESNSEQQQQQQRD